MLIDQSLAYASRRKNQSGHERLGQAIIRASSEMGAEWLGS